MLDSLELSLDRQAMPGGALYVVATPIGNLADISVRALRVLRTVDLIAAEDTRTARALLKHYGIEAPRMLATHEHNERAAAETVIAALREGQRVACVSDAGTPAISDPGARLVQSVRAAGLRVIPIPGASSVITALSAAGIDTGEGRFYFAGFLSSRPAERRAQIAAMRGVDGALVLLEAPHRVKSTVKDLVEGLPDRAQIGFARELTKQFEDIATVARADALAWLEADPHREKGEYVLVVWPAQAAPAADGLEEGARRTLGILLEALPLKQAVALAARLTGVSRNALYDAALAMKRAAEDGGEGGDEEGDGQEDRGGAGDLQV